MARSNPWSLVAIGDMVVVMIYVAKIENRDGDNRVDDGLNSRYTSRTVDSDVCVVMTFFR